jgi:hypothetical protein
VEFHQTMLMQKHGGREQAVALELTALELAALDQRLGTLAKNFLSRQDALNAQLRSQCVQ